VRFDLDVSKVLRIKSLTVQLATAAVGRELYQLETIPALGAAMVRRQTTKVTERGDKAACSMA
jgi:hypothetical protein